MKYIIQIVIGLALIATGVLHQISMQTFEIRLYELLGLDWMMLPVWGRIWSAFEIYLGLALILRINPKRTTSYLLTLVTIFVLYDGIWELFFNPNKLYIVIWPFYELDGTVYSYMKFILALILSAYVLWDLKTIKSTDLKWKWIKFVLPAGALSFTIIYNAVLPRDFRFTEGEIQTEMTLEEINASIKEGDELIAEEGDQVLLFISLSCSHCFFTTKKIAAIKRKNPDLNVRLMLFNTKNVDQFLEYARAEEIPYSLVSGDTFLEVTGGSVPGILHIGEGEIQHQWGGKGNTFNYAAISFVQNLN